MVNPNRLLYLFQGIYMGKPAKTWRKKGVDIACWQDDNGRRSFTLRKQYLNKQNNTWVDTKYLYQDDLRALVELLQDAIAWNSDGADRQEHDNAYKASMAENMVASLAAGKAVNFDDDDLPF